ncbi:RHS repeat-associated core domain-containing protein [Pseudomonas syringae group sp. J309-1]|uniref:RHS repeat-associated core domain-containing protein n=1 Tax=Pseudomonas syringae group sp. J309-1 TaxID=3079588 RepID=UPI002907275B|nr:RHS repeat-associated core domain-containing protein [Pseudomonas syringae group sp. J309-1]MDU8360013.1 RHS repeat-associated core domain-containing protein [Pseudomonas syringae group sp. J309-1]
MSGLPVSHVGEKVSGNVIATGSPTVHVGSSGVGMADRVSACVPNVGQPVNPMLGCKLLPEEVDFALTAPDTFSFGRGYLSSNPRVSKLGQGWSLPGESVTLELDANTCVLIDVQGRRITFPALEPGKIHYSGSEQLWLRRGGVSSEQPLFSPWKGRWSPVPPAIQASEAAVLLLAGNSYLCFMRQPDGVWRLHSAFGRSGYLTEFGWSRRGFLASIRDSAGRSYGLVYQQVCAPQAGDDGVRLCGVILANTDGPIPESFDPQALGNDWLVRYEFNEVGDLIAVRDRSGERVRVFAWNNHIMTAHGEPGGQEVRYEWDTHLPSGRVVKQSEAEGLVREFRYYADATDVIDSMGRVERYEFSGSDGERRWTALVRADGSRTEFEYDLFGRLVVIRDPLGRESRRRLDGQGRVLEEESPGKSRYRKTLDEETGLLNELVNSMGRSWRFERDTRSNLTRATGPGGTTLYRYDDSSLPDRPTQVIDSKGGVKTFQWSRLGLPVSVTDCSGQTYRYEYDLEGRLIAEIDPAGQISRRSYDLLGQVTGLSFPDGASLVYRYDKQGRQTHMADAQGHCTQFFWDRYGRLLRAVDSAGQELNYLYDAAGRLCMLTNQNGAKARFAWDELDRLVEENGFDGRRQQYRYNLADELVVRIDGEQRETHYQYNLDGRVVSTNFPATANAAAFSEHYSWLADGRLASVRGPDCEVRFAYDDAGNLCLESQIHADGWVYSVQHQHDELGKRESSQYGDAPLVKWLTYGSGHLHGVMVEQVELSFERDALHREKHRDARLKGKPQTLFDQQRDYDASGRLAQSKLTRSGADGWQRSYRYDLLGQLTQIDDSVSSALKYQYDLSGRLVSSRRGNTVEQLYRFDPAGNRLDTAGLQGAEKLLQHEHNELYRSGYTDSQRSALAQGVDSSCLGNRVEVFQGSTYRYDASGHLIERKDSDGQRLLLAYDGANRLIHMLRQRPDGEHVEARYRYDALSRRIAKTVREGAEQQRVRYGWDGERQCAEAFERLLRTTVHEPESFVPMLRIEQSCEPDTPELLEIRRAMAAEDQPLPAQCHPVLGAPSISFFHTDHIGTPLQLSDQDGQVTWQAHPDTWRGVTEETGSTDQPIRFQGQHHDDESGLYYNRHRYYLPEIGRYASQDPIGFRGGPNAYVYALNAPSVAYDPSGLIVPLIILAGAFLGRAALGATIEVGMQAGKQLLGQVKDNWDNDRDLMDFKWGCIDINWKHVGAAGAFGAVAPGLFGSAKTVLTSSKALKTLSGQAANTANRAAKLAARKAAHTNTLKTTVATQAAWQTGKVIVNCPLKDEDEECQNQ